MTTEAEYEPEMGLTFEKVWAMFRETDRKFQETDRQFKETDRKFQETDRKFQETDRRFQETDRQFKETDRKLQETDRKIGKLGGRFGELIEHLVAPNMLEKFNKLGYDFGKIGLDVCFKDTKLSLAAEVDILLENGDVALAAEVKSKLTISDVKDHIERMGKLRSYADEHKDRRKLLGAVAGAIVPDGVKSFALKNGFYVLQQAGDTVKIDIPEGFTPKEW
jgi:hypothetical protein